MLNHVVIINAFDKNEEFIGKLSKVYEQALRSRGIVPEVLYVNNMTFSFSPFPEQYAFNTLEYDLQRSVSAIKAAPTVSIFTSTQKANQSPVFRQFFARLFHLKSGSINYDIWGNVLAYNKVLRIITVLDDPDIWKEFHKNRNKWVVPIPKASFGLFGFGQIYSRTFGYLKDNDINNEYGKKSVRAMQNMAEKD